MASIGRLIWPIRAGVGGCLSCDWFKRSADACPVSLVIRETVVNSTLDRCYDLSSAGKVGFQCSAWTFDSPVYSYGLYVTETGGTFAQRHTKVDIWKAYRDAVWTSSTTIDIYDYVFGGPASRTYICGIADASPSGSAGFITSDSVTVSVPAGVGPPTAKVATITVNDDGTFSIA